MNFQTRVLSTFVQIKTLYNVLTVKVILKFWLRSSLYTKQGHAFMGVYDSRWLYHITQDDHSLFNCLNFAMYAVYNNIVLVVLKMYKLLEYVPHFAKNKQKHKFTVYRSLLECSYNAHNDIGANNAPAWVFVFYICIILYS